MLKTEIITSLKPILREKNFKKIRNYWYKEQNGMTFYLNIQGSAYDTNDFYVNLGIVFSLIDKKVPPTYDWDIFRRAFVDNKELNLEIEDILLILDAFLKLFPTIENAQTFVQNQKSKYEYIVISEHYKLI